MRPVDYFEQNHIMPGTHITIPRGENDMPNNANAVQLGDVPNRATTYTVPVYPKGNDDNTDIGQG